jgi:DNA anti-recombination protein RmuC
MGKYVIPTPSSSHSRYGTQVNLELKERKLKVAKLSNQLLEKERKIDEQIEKMQNESNRRINEIQKEANRHVEEIQKESKRQYDLLVSRILGKMVV